MNRNAATFALIVLSVFIFLPTVFSSNVVLAQSSNYSIQSVEHNIEVLFSGHVVIRDEIKVSGSLTNGFLIGFPSAFSNSVLEVVAYDNDQAFLVDTGVSIGQSGFYGARVNFNGSNPSSFTVVFVLSNSLITQDAGYYLLQYPAYPSFAVNAGSCSVTLSLPAEPDVISISKSDGTINSTAYSKTNLAAYTNIEAKAAFGITYGLLQLNTISNLERIITIDQAGSITCADSYQIRNIDEYRMFSFLFNLPSQATNVVVKDNSGKMLNSVSLGSAGKIIIVNATFSSFLAQGQSTALTAIYNIPSSGNTINFEVFPAINYYAEQGIVKIKLPEGAKIISPQAGNLDSSTEITKDGYQETLTITRKGVSYVDYTTPNYNTLKLSYDYNPLWSSYAPTIWAFGLASIACVGIAFWKKYNNIAQEKTLKTYKHKAKTKSSLNGIPQKTAHSNRERIKQFIEEYEDRMEIINEIEILDQKAQKGKMQRSNYRIQKRRLENHYETLTKNINETKEAFLRKSGELADLVKKLELAEEDYKKTAERVRNLEAGQRSGEVSIEKYKEKADEYRENKEEAESVINGILLRIREKIH